MPLRLVNTIISGNVGVNFGGDPSINININNFIGGDAQLAFLADNGGTVPTHIPLPGSPLINAGSGCVLIVNGCGTSHSAFPSDQRGANAPRKIGASVDIGAFERNITFDPSTLPNGNYNVAYTQQLSASRQTNLSESGEKTSEYMLNIAPELFEIIAVDGQSLPPGITLSSGGLLSGIPTVAGTYNFTVKAVDSDGVAGVQQYTMQIFGPTAAGVSVSGRILTAEGGGVGNARVILTDSRGNSRTVLTKTFGNYRFDDVTVGETYIVTVAFKRKTVATQIISVADDITELNFTVNQ